MPSRRSSLTQTSFLLALFAAGAATGAVAQDFRVATTVRRLDPERSRWMPVATTITWFHANKVYDYMQQIEEVVIFDRERGQSEILSVNGNNLATSLQFPQLRQYLKVAKSETLEHLQQLAPGPRRDALLFQLNPEFDRSFDSDSGTLTLTGPHIRYEIETVAVEKPRIVQQYLQYADWAARMNYVLHSGTLYPEVRLSVNRALSEQDRLPTKVLLHLGGERPVQLQAEHTFDWGLDSVGQHIISECEKARTADETRWVNFVDYQQSILTTTVRK